MNWTTLVEAADLARALGDPALRVVDARFVILNAAPDAGRTAYAESHIPDAVYADLNRDLSDLSKVGEGRHPLPDSVAFTRRLGEWGIGPSPQVVVYDAGDGSMAAARAWWLLKLLGHARVAVLDGGLAEWPASSTRARCWRGSAKRRAGCWTHATASVSAARSSRSTRWPGTCPGRSTGRWG